MSSGNIIAEEMGDEKCPAGGPAIGRCSLCGAGPGEACKADTEIAVVSEIGVDQFRT